MGLVQRRYFGTNKRDQSLLKTDGTRVNTVNLDRKDLVRFEELLPRHRDNVVNRVVDLVLVVSRVTQL